MNISESRKFLEKLEIPRIENKPKTFLEIARQPHYENVISNIYAFFLNVNEEHGFADLFIRSLLACINDKSSHLSKDFSSFNEFEIETEYPTKGLGKTGNRGRIDLLLYNNEQAILIENKVYHLLNNDLDDYWNSVKLETSHAISKIGIILSLKPISSDNWEQFTNKNEFINITHLELISKIKELKTEYEAQANTHFLFVLNDFIQNIQKISMPIMEKQNIQFFVENKEKINQLEIFKNEFRKHVILEVEKAGNSIIGVTISRQKTSQNRRLRYFQSKKHSDLMYVVVFEELFQSSNLLHLIIEVRGKTLRNSNFFKNIHFEANEKSILKDDFYKKTESTWAHFAHKVYELDENAIYNLSDFIEKKIKDDYFETVFLKLSKYLSDNFK